MNSRAFSSYVAANKSSVPVKHFVNNIHLVRSTSSLIKNPKNSTRNNTTNSSPNNPTSRSTCSSTTNSPKKPSHSTLKCNSEDNKKQSCENKEFTSNLLFNNKRITHYEVLGLSTNCTSKEIKSAYRNLSKIYHPDKNPNEVEIASNIFRTIHEAYMVLVDPEKRRDYDLNTVLEEVNSFKRNHTVHEESKETIKIHFDSSLDINYTIHCHLGDLLKGKGKKFQINRKIVCPHCLNQSSKISSLCENCENTKYITISELVKIRIEPGMFSGQTILIPRKGDELLKNQNEMFVGNLVFTLKEIPHNNFVRFNNNNLFTSIFCNRLQKNLQLNFIDGRIFSFENPLNKNKTNKCIKCIRNEGMPVLRNTNDYYGDLFIEFKVMDDINRMNEENNSLDKSICEIELSDINNEERIIIENNEEISLFKCRNKL
ncbi:hypothetical protein ABK040_004764 [Willaertia magna]